MKYPDQGFSRNILAAFIDADLRLVLIVSAIGLILWALMGIAYPQGVVELVNLLSFGSYEFWIGNCLITGFSMIYCVGRNFPSLFSQIVGAWIATFWTWTVFNRAVSSSYALGISMNIIYVCIGLMLLHRSAKEVS